MKKLIFFSLIAVLFLIVGCDLFCPEPPVVIKYTLEASASVGGTISPSGKIEVLKGTSQTFTLTPNAGFRADSISIINAYGSGKTVAVTNNTYTLLNITGNYIVKAVFIDTQLELNFQLLTQKLWKNTIFQARRIGTTDWYTQSVEGSGTGTWIFDKNYFFDHFAHNDNVPTGGGHYVLKQDSLIIGSTYPDDGRSGLRFKILTLSENTLLIRRQGHYYDPNGPDPTKDIEEQYTYIHP